MLQNEELYILAAKSKRRPFNKAMKCLLFGENGNDLKEDKLEEIAREGKYNAEYDLDQYSLLLVLLVEPPVQEPQPAPTQQ